MHCSASPSYGLPSIGTASVLYLMLLPYAASHSGSSRGRARLTSDHDNGCSPVCGPCAALLPAASSPSAFCLSSPTLCYPAAGIICTLLEKRVGFHMRSPGQQQNQRQHQQQHPLPTFQCHGVPPAPSVTASPCRRRLPPPPSPRGQSSRDDSLDVACLVARPHSRPTTTHPDIAPTAITTPHP